MFPGSGIELCLGAGRVQERQMNCKGGCSLEDGGGRAQGALRQHGAQAGAAQ